MSIFGWRHRSSRSHRPKPAPGSATIARDRLTVLLAHEAVAGTSGDLLGVLCEKIVAVIRRHLTAEPEQIHVEMHRGTSLVTLAIEVEIPAW